MRVAARHADGGGNRRSGMTNREKVVVRFQRAGESADVPLLAELVKVARATGQHLVRVRLMADIPEQPVWPGRIGAKVVDVMQGDSQLADAQVGGQMPAIFA